jgi:hypothetical protein
MGDRLAGGSGGNIGMNLRGVTALTTALLAAALGLASTPAIAFAASSGGISAGPLHWDPSNPATRTYYIPTVQPGGIFRDQMRVQNPNADSVDLYVDAVDGITATPSGAVYANRTDPVVKWGAWVTTDVPTLTLAAGQSALVGFTVRVPADATPGDHLAGVAFENSHPITGSGAISITSINRTVVGILVEVPGPASFQLAVGTPTFHPLSTKGYASLIVPLEDTGRRLGKPRVTVRLNGPNGYHRSITLQLDTLLPGDLIQYPFPWPDTLPAGTYAVTVTGTLPPMNPVSITASIVLGATLPGVPVPATAAQPAPASVRAVLPSWAVPVLVVGSLLLLLALIAAVVFLVMVLRQRRRADAAALAASSGTPL